MAIEIRDGPVVVVGSAVVDRIFRVESLPFPGETARAGEVRAALGGKGANQAVACRRLGAPTVFVGCVGDDEGGRDTEEDLRQAGVELRLSHTSDAPTGYAAVVVSAEGENLIAVHLGANDHLSPARLEDAREHLRRAAVLVTQMEVPPDTVEAAAERAREAGALLLLNAAPVHEEAARLLPSFDVVVANRGEAEHLTGVAIATLDDALAALRALRDQGVDEPVVTLGAAGAVCLDRGRGLHVPAPAVEAVDATGAGDAFVGALAAFLREGMEMRDAAALACEYAAQAVTRTGARAAYLDRGAFEARRA